jgi:RNA polymerase sigma-70 factor (ECF subfamily)
MGVIRRVRRDQAFEAAFPGLYHRAHAVATRIVGDADSAEDVAAEALARTYVQWGKVRDLPYLEAWVLRVAANVALDVVRRRKPAVASRSGVDPAEQVVDRLFVTGELRRLSKRQQEVVVLRYVADMPEADVASCLGVGVETVKEHAARAMRALRAGVEKEAGRAVV